MIDIKPCPFCGGKAKVKKAPWDRSEEGSSICEVYCTECHASIYGETFNFYQVKYDSDNPQDQKSAIEKWNKRRCLSANLEEIRKALDASTIDYNISEEIMNLLSVNSLNMKEGD